jgi:predicted HAD superfamily phosphohydrolase
MMEDKKQIPEEMKTTILKIAKVNRSALEANEILDLLDSIIQDNSMELQTKVEKIESIRLLLIKP